MSKICPILYTDMPYPAAGNDILKNAGTKQFGRTQLEIERMDMLLEEKNYADAAKRLGITENALYKSMNRVLTRYAAAKMFCNMVETWKRGRRDLKRGKKA